jgi:hypothetical protein
MTATWRTAARNPDGSITFTDTDGASERHAGPAAERMAGTLAGYDATAGLDPMAGEDLDEKDPDALAAQARIGNLDPMYGPDLNDETRGIAPTHQRVPDAPAHPSGGGLMGAVDPGLARAVAADREAQMAQATAKAAPRKPASMMIDVGDGSASPPVSVGLGAPQWTVTPAAPAADGGVLAAAGRAAAAGGLGATMPAAQGGAPPPSAVPYQIADGPKRVAIPTEAPPAGSPGGALVATPQQAAAGGPAPQGGGGGGGVDPSGSEVARMRLLGFNNAQIEAELRKRPGPAQRVPEMQQLTDRTLQIAGGPSPETVAEQEEILRRGGQVRAGRQDLNDADKAEQARVAALRGNTDGIYDKNTEKVLAERDKTLAGLNDQRERLYKDIDEGKIDPARFWNSKSTGEQIVSVLAMAFSGIGAAIQGHGAVNLAMKSFDESVAADIDAQKSNLAKKQWQASEIGRIYEQTKLATGDKIIAINEARAAALKRFDQLAAQKAAVVGTPEAAQKAQEIKLDVDAQIAALHAASDARVAEGQHIRVIPAHMTGGGGGPSAKVLRQLLQENVDLTTKGESHVSQLGKDAREARGKPGDDPAAGYVPLGSGTIDVSHLPNDERAKVRAISSAYQQGKKSVAELEKLPASSKANPFDVGASVYGDDVAYSYAAVKGQGQTNKDQMEAARAQLANVWKVGGAAAVKRVLDGAAQATARVYGRGGK